ncbi:MAG: AsmA-like C-terminal region-containing protein [Bacteroidia bacterium]
MKKFLKIFGVIILLLIVVAIAVPFIFKDKIAAKAKEEINNNVNAKVNFADFDLTMLSSFPNLTFKLNKFSIIGINDFDGDTLTYIDQLKLKLSIWDVISGSQYKIKSIILDKPYINILVLKNGKANYDIAKTDSSKKDEAGKSSSFKLALQHYEINEAIISYDDASSGFKARMDNMNHSGSGDFTQDLFTLSTKTDIEKTNLSSGGVSYLNDVKTSLKADLDMDMKNMKFTFKENLLELNALGLGFDGYVAMPADDITMDIKWNVKQSEFKSFISLIPAVYSKDFKSVKSAGKLSANGFVKGTYNEKSIPAYSLNLNIENGMFKYPDLPTALNNVQVDLKVNNPDGVTDHTVIDLKKMHVEFGTEPFDARLHVTTPVSDPNIDATVKGTVNLANLKNMIPMDKGTDLNGILKADFAAKGRYSAVEKQQYQDFTASGSMSLSDMNYKSEDFKQGALIKQVMMTFNPRNITLNNLDVKTGKSDVQADGTLDNFLAYYFKKETLKGTLNVRSTLLDLNEFMGTSSTTTTTTAPTTTSTKSTVVEIPANIDFGLNATVAKILYDNMVIENLKGKMTIRDAELKMDNVAFNMLEGNVNMSGLYGTKNVKQPDIAYNMTIDNFDIQKTVATFNTVKKLAPIAERANGKFSTSLNVTGKLDQTMSPVLPSLNGSGKLSSKSVTINNFEPLNKLGDALKMEQYKKLSLNDLNINYDFKDGRVNVKPFTTSLAGTKATIEGSNGFDQTIDYKLSLEIPKSLIPAAAQSTMTGLLAKANSALGSNITLPDPLKLGVGIGGTVSKPTIKTDAGESAKGAVTMVKDAVIAKGKEEARKEADKLIAEAEIKAKEIKDAAKVASDKVRKEGYAQADALIKKAGDNPLAKVGAQQASFKLKKETDKKADQVISEANKQADGIVNDAKKKADDMLK